MQLQLGPQERRQLKSVADMFLSKKADFALHVRSIFTGLDSFEAFNQFTQWEVLYKHVIGSLKRAHMNFEKALQEQEKVDKFWRDMRREALIGVFTAALTAVGVGFIGTYMKEFLKSDFLADVGVKMSDFWQEVANKWVQEVYKDSFRSAVGKKAIGEGLDKVGLFQGYKKGINAQKKAKLDPMSFTKRLADLEQSLGKLQNELRERFIRTVKNTTEIRDENHLRQLFFQVCRAYVNSNRLGGGVNRTNMFASIGYVGNLSTLHRSTAGKLGFMLDDRMHEYQYQDAVEEWTRVVRNDMKQGLKTMFDCPINPHEKDLEQSVLVLEKMLWAEWVLAASEQKLGRRRADITQHLNQLTMRQRMSGKNYLMAQSDSVKRFYQSKNRDSSVLHDLGKKIVERLQKLNIVNRRDQRYSVFERQKEKDRLWQEEHALQSGIVYVSKEASGKITGRRGKGRLVQWASGYLAEEPLKKELGFDALQRRHWGGNALTDVTF